MKIRIMAGEMARLHNINKQTLIYYDKIGLFRPENTDEETGYRYYSLEQAQVLEVILILKQFGMPLKEIRDFLDKGDTGERIALLHEQLKMMDDKIAQFQKNKMRIGATIENLTKRLAVVPRQFSVRRQPGRRALSTTVAPPYDDYQLELAVRHLLDTEIADEEGAYFYLYGFPKKVAEKTIQYDKVSLPLPGDWPDHDDTAETIPAGWYACYNHQGPYITIGDSWQRLLSHIERSGYIIIGKPLEKWYLDAMAVRDSDYYLVELQIQVEKQ